MKKLIILLWGKASAFLKQLVYRKKKKVQKPSIRNINDELRGYTGTDQWHRHSLTGALFTDGVLALANNYECHWLISDILVLATSKEYRREEFQVWRLDRVIRRENGVIVEKRNSFFLICEDGNYRRVAEPTYYSISDFPGDVVQLYFENNVLHLPSER